MRFKSGKIAYHLPKDFHELDSVAVKVRNMHMPLCCVGWREMVAIYAKTGKQYGVPSYCCISPNNKFIEFFPSPDKAYLFSIYYKKLCVK